MTCSLSLKNKVGFINGSIEKSDGSDADKSSNPKPSQADSGSLLRQAAVLLILYFSLGVLIYSFNRDHFSGLETHPVVDALYFCVVTMCTIGYGDIAPVTPSAKLFSCFFVLVGFGFIDIMLSGVVNYVLDLQENMVLNSIKMHQAGAGWGEHGQISKKGKKNPGTNRESVLLLQFLEQVLKGKEMEIDSWHILMRMKSAPKEGSCDPIAPLELPHSLHAFNRVSDTDELNVSGGAYNSAS